LIYINPLLASVAGSFVLEAKKQKSARTAKAAPDGAGDAWTAVDAGVVSIIPSLVADSYSAIMSQTIGA